MRYNYKYAMPVDPKVLQEDFKSEGLHLIPLLVSKLRREDINSFHEVEELVRQITRDLWFSINKGHGINLRDREKLIPVFQEYARIFKRYEDRPDVVYRSVTLPNVYANYLTVIKNKAKKIKVLEGLAYGLRSWTALESEADYWRRQGDDDKDTVTFVMERPKIIFDCNSYFSQYSPHPSEYPFDPHEIICFVENPIILDIVKVQEKTEYASIWEVRVKQG